MMKKTLRDSSRVARTGCFTKDSSPRKKKTLTTFLLWMRFVVTKSSPRLHRRALTHVPFDVPPTQCCVSHESTFGHVTFGIWRVCHTETWSRSYRYSYVFFYNHEWYMCVSPCISIFADSPVAKCTHTSFFWPFTLEGLQCIQITGTINTSWTMDNMDWSPGWKDHWTLPRCKAAKNIAVLFFAVV